MDEPLSNLDAKLRVQMRAEVSRIQNRLGTTTVYVTHDQTEAMTLGDRVAVMRAGMLQQVDTPKELYDNPVNIFVAGFMGSPAMNFFPARVEGDQLKLSFASIPIQGRLRDAAQRVTGGDLIAGVRPEHFYDPAIENVQGGTTFDAPIELVESMGSEVYAHFSTGESGVQSEELAELAADSGAADVPSSGEGLAVARLEPTTKAKAGESLQLGLHPETIHLFDVRSGRNLVLSGGGDGAAGTAPVQQAETSQPAETSEPAETGEPADTSQPAEPTRPAGDQPSSGGETTSLS
jgi:multiple sugar transport system ATP-binding protein